MTSGERSIDLAAMELYEASLDVAPAERRAWIEGRDDVDEAVRAAALALLAAEDDPISPLRTGGASGLGEIDEPVPVQIGAYRILRLLGRGGMGAVYLGERASDDFEHVVAIKVIKAGLLSDTLVERFRRERQILAQLNHRNIAHLHDGGETAEGSPFIVMEYVDGQPLLAWIESERPDRDRRLALFAQICDAVAFAHQNLVIHRDLTPSNILVREGDEAKLIDFGIARPHVEGDADELTSTLGGMSLTPGFAAPERKTGAAANTLSDVYSLGRILDILTEGEQDGELGAIIAKATREDPAERYATASALAEEIKAYRTGYPVSAFSGHRFYAARKLVARQKLAVAASALAVLLLIGGLAATGWAYHRAQVARAEAEQRFGDVRELAKFMLFDLYDELQPVTGNTKALADIADKSREYLDALTATDLSSTDLRLEAALGYKRLSDVLGNPEGPNLGRREEAGKALRQAVAMLGELHEAEPDNAAVTRALAQADYALSSFIFIAEDKSEEAIPPAAASTALYDRLIDNGAATPADKLHRIESRLQEAKPLVWIDQGEKAIAQMTDVTAEIDALAQADPGDPATRLMQARVYSALSSAMSWHYDPKGPDYPRAVPLSDKAIDILTDLYARTPDDRATQQALLSFVYTRALIHYDLENWTRARDDLRQAEQLATAMIAKDPDDSGMIRRLQTIQGQLAPVLVETGQDDEAIAMARKVLDQRNALLATAPDDPGYYRDRASAIMLLGETLVSAGRTAQGCATYRNAAAEWVVIERRWGVSDLNRRNDVDYIAAQLAKCPPS